MDEQRLYLMRHGEAEKGAGQVETDLFSTGDHSLSDRGVAQARAMAELLGSVALDAVITSPARRCRETAQLVAAPHGLEVQVDERLWELSFAEPGTPYRELVARIVDLARALRDGKDPMLGKEALSQVRARFRAAIDEALAHHHRPLVVAHGAQNRLFLTHVLGLPDHHLFRLEQDHGCLNVVGLRGGRATLLKLNVTGQPLWSEASSLRASDVLG